MFRFITYGVGEPGAVDECMQTVARDPLVQDWVQAAELERETIVPSEVGLRQGSA